MSAVKIAQKHAQRIADAARDRRALIARHHPDIEAFVLDIHAAFPSARLTAIASPEITWTRDGADLWEDGIHVPADQWLAEGRAHREFVQKQEKKTR